MNYQRILVEFRQLMNYQSIWKYHQKILLWRRKQVVTPSSIHETVYENDGDPITLLDQIDDGNEGKWFDKIALKRSDSRIRRTRKINCLFTIL